MKRFAVITLLALSTLAVSCTFNDDTTPIVQTIDIMPEMWQPSGRLGQEDYYLYATVSVPIITRSVINHGVTSVYLLAEYGDVPLPHIQPFNGFISTLSYEVSQGHITFILMDSDFRTEPYRTPLRFKLVVIE